MKDILFCIVLMLYWSHAFIIGWFWDEEQQKRGCASVQNEACKHCGIQRLFWRFVKGVLYIVNDFTRSEVVIKTHGLSLSSADGHLYIVMEFCSGGDLLQRIRQQKNVLFPEDVVWQRWLYSSQINSSN